MLKNSPQKILSVLLFSVLAYPTQSQTSWIEIPKTLVASVLASQMDLVALELLKYCSLENKSSHARAKNLGYKGFVPLGQHDGFQDVVFFVRKNPPRTVMLGERLIRVKGSDLQITATACGLIAGGKLSDFGLDRLLSALGSSQTASDNRVQMEDDLSHNTAESWMLPLVGSTYFAIAVRNGSVNGQPLSTVTLLQLQKPEE